MTAQGEFGCAAARHAVHAGLDTELVDAAVAERLEAHLEGCAECREFADEMRSIQRGLRSLPELELPDSVLEEVWNRTRRAPARARSRPRYLAVAATAVVILVLGGLWLRHEPVPAGPTESELQRAALEARLVLGLASQALRKTEQAAFKDVLAGEVSGALRRAPIEWPRRGEGERRGS